MPGSGSLETTMLSVRTFGLHDRARFQKESGERDRFFERAAAIAAQINHQAGNVFLLQPFQQRQHILGGALLVLVHVGIKRRQA